MLTYFPGNVKKTKKSMSYQQRNKADGDNEESCTSTPRLIGKKTQMCVHQ